MSVVQLGVVAAVWDLCRIGKLDALHAVAAFLVVAVPGAATIAARLIRGLPTKR
jgi:hypothetical protein